MPTCMFTLCLRICFDANIPRHTTRIVKYILFYALVAINVVLATDSRGVTDDHGYPGR